MSYLAEPNELLSLEAMKAFRTTSVQSAYGAASNLYTQVNELMNGLVQLPSLRGHRPEDISSFDNDVCEPLKLQFREELQNYQGLSDMKDVGTLISARLSEIIKAVEEPGKRHPHPTKKSMHAALNAAYDTLNPESEHGKHYRAILEQSAALLELPELGQAATKRIGGSGRGRKR